MYIYYSIYKYIYIYIYILSLSLSLALALTLSLFLFSILLYCKLTISPFISFHWDYFLCLCFSWANMWSVVEKPALNPACSGPIILLLSTKSVSL